MIQTTLSKEAASKLFEANALYWVGYNVIPECRVSSLFDDDVLDFYRCKKGKAFREDMEYMLLTGENGSITLFTWKGFLELVAYHNFRLLMTDEEFAIGKKTDSEKALRARWNLA